jgi:hypothetical protein
MRVLTWTLLGLAVAMPACKQDNPAFDEPGLSTSSGSETTAGAASTEAPGTVTGSSTGDSDGTGSASTTSSDTTASTTSSSSSSGGSDTGGCAAPLVMCGDQCVDTSSDRDHCGACDEACPGNQVCVRSDCRPNN